MSLEENEHFFCPSCGEPNGLLVDLTAGPAQEFVVDCEVCCAPIVVYLKIRGGRGVDIDVRKENE